MPEEEQSTNQRLGAIKDVLIGLAILVFWAAMLVSISVVAVIASIFINPLLGLLICISGFWVWKYLGARPFPGFADGCICIAGYTWVFGITLGHLAICIKYLFR